VFFVGFAHKKHSPPHFIKKIRKFDLSDIEERKFRHHYQKAYEMCLNATSTKVAPWYIVPADDKENARLIVSQIILDTLNKLGMSYSEVDQARQQLLQSIHKLLTREDNSAE